MGTKGGGRSAVAAFRHRDFSVIWAGALVSNTGTWCQGVAVPFVVYQLTHSPTWVGIAAFAQFFPIVVLGPFAGSLADRVPRRRILFVTQGLLTLSALGLWALWESGVDEPGWFVAAIAVNGAFAGVNITAWQTFVTELVPRELLTNAITLNSTQFNAARAFGPALGGVVLTHGGPGWAFLLNALSYLAVFAALAAVRPPARAPVAPADRPPLFRGLGPTLRYAAARPGIATCMAVVIALGLIGAPLFSLLVVFAEDVFEVTGSRYGLLGASLGLGSLLAAPFVAGRATAVRRSHLTLVALVVYGCAVAAFGASPSYWYGVGALAVAGACYLTLASTLNSTVHLLVDEEMRGRVVALYLMVLTAAAPLGALVLGWLADRVGPRPTVVGGGLAVVGYAFWLRRRGSFDGMDEDGLAAPALAPVSAGRRPAPDAPGLPRTMEVPDTTGMPAPGA